ncbi:MAG: hypothetical protein K0R26_1453 [Bacteroidota bacterium]|jgi:hypothetical protein|nr:hypothetical protein [Bacteroidota bacterium]
MILRICFFIFFVISLQTVGIAQESGGKSDPPKKDQSIKSKRKQRQADKKKWKEDRKNKRLEEKKIRDHHKRIQTKEVRKRMKKSKGKAIRNNTHQREPFFQRMFQKKRGKGSRQSKEKAPKVQQ